MVRRTKSAAPVSWKNAWDGRITWSGAQLPSRGTSAAVRRCAFKTHRLPLFPIPP
ncbi:hypothetical protein RSPO_c00390 [Ralstonia solanacearum Po82]|uniref:Uncharacterized protein n=1 Tax=Ralstonia solanacearum (strain Po82) TaxID=1031711 RepID=F6G6Z9_RALS8|nr:hypothetical protein RSPO_c00390 [Ralstonia solanacearum Po82]